MTESPPCLLWVGCSFSYWLKLVTNRQTDAQQFHKSFAMVYSVDAELSQKDNSLSIKRFANISPAFLHLFFSVDIEFACPWSPSRFSGQCMIQTVILWLFSVDVFCVSFFSPNFTVS